MNRPVQRSHRERLNNISLTRPTFVYRCGVIPTAGDNAIIRLGGILPTIAVALPADAADQKMPSGRTTQPCTRRLPRMHRVRAAPHTSTTTAALAQMIPPPETGPERVRQSPPVPMMPAGRTHNRGRAPALSTFEWLSYNPPILHIRSPSGTSLGEFSPAAIHAVLPLLKAPSQSTAVAPNVAACSLTMLLVIPLRRARRIRGLWVPVPENSGGACSVVSQRSYV